MFAYCYGRLLRYHGANEDSAKHLRYAFENIEVGGYDVSFCSWSADHLALVLRDLRQPQETKALADRAIEYLIKTVAEGPYQADEQRILYQHISWVLEERPVETVAKIVENIQPNYQWLFHMASGQLEKRRAWAARGGGWARDVKEEGWKGFAEHMEGAAYHFHEAWTTNPHWPESATKMIAVAMAGHAPVGETPRLWFDRAVEVQLDYHPAYTALMWALRPRWGGSHEQIYALGRECLGTGRFDTHVPYLFLEACESIINDVGASFDFYQAPGVYDDLQAMADGYLDEPEMEALHDWYRSLKVSVAVRCGKWEDAHQFLLALENEPHENAFIRLGLKPDVIGEVYARSGELAEKNTEAERLAEEGKFDQAKSLYEELLAKTGDEQRVTTYFRGRMRDVEFDQSYSDENWTKLPLDEHLTGWESMAGDWSINNNGRLVGKPQRDGLRLVFEKKLGTRFELRGKMIFVSRAYRGDNAAVYFGQEGGALSNSFRIVCDDNYAAVLKRNDPIARKEIPIEETNPFRIQRWDNHITAYLNDQLIANNVEIEPEGPPESEVIALGGRYWYTGPVLRFDDLEVRTLKEQPAVDGAEQEAAEPAVEAEPAEEPESVEAEDSGA
jgi:hypothetical protein